MLSEALKRRSSQLDSDLEEYDLLDLPDSWIWVNIDSISDVKGGKRLPKGEKLVENDTGYPYIKAGNLKNGTVTLDDIEYIPTRIQPLIKNYVVAAGDVYITIVGACIGDAGTICKELDGANLTENAAKISNLSNANNEYLALWLRSPLCQKIIKTKILSAAQGKLALTRIKTIPVPLAPIQEQSEIVTKSADILKSSDQTTELYEKIQSNLDWLDRSILAKAFRGELVEQDPNDEPASILLERIRAEREQQTQGNAKKPGKKGQRTIKTDPP
jgi:type I restriction enzyme S subunit